MKYLAGLIILLALIVFSCAACSQGYMTSKKVKKLIEQELSVGDSQQKIENFLKKHNVDFSYRERFERYSCIIRNPRNYKNKDYHAIVIYIYVDDEMSFVSSEVRDSYTFL